MDSFPLVIIGSGPAGVAAAASYLKAGGAQPVLMLTADEDTPYLRPPLSKEALRDPDADAHQPLDDDVEALGVQLRRSSPVSSVDLDARTVRFGQEQVGFETLVLAPGSTPSSLPGLPPDAETYLLRSLADLRRLTQAAAHARTAVVVGSGFIGCEAAASLAIRGLEVTVVTPEDGPQRQRLGDRTGQAIESWLGELGVTLRAGVEVASVESPRRVHLGDGTTLEPDLLVLALGVTPATGFLEASGLPMHEGRIVTDARLQTSTRGVLAAGDAAYAEHAVAGRPVPVEHWGDAEAMGEVAGCNAAGQSRTWDAVPGFWSEIGEHTLMYSAWGDGFDEVEVVEGSDAHRGGDTAGDGDDAGADGDGDEKAGAFTVWYGHEGDLVGVLAYQNEADYERGQQLIADGSSLAEAVHPG